MHSLSLCRVCWQACQNGLVVDWEFTTHFANRPITRYHCSPGRKSGEELASRMKKLDRSLTSSIPHSHQIVLTQKLKPYKQVWGDELCHFLDHIKRHNLPMSIILIILLIRDMSVEHEFSIKSLKLPPKTLMSWKSLILAGCPSLAPYPNIMATHLTIHSTKQFYNSPSLHLEAWFPGLGCTCK